MHARVGGTVDTDELAGRRAGATADEPNERVTPDEPPQLGARLLRDRGELGPCDDRRQRPVDVEQDRGAVRVLRELRKRILHSRENTAVLRLVLIGLLAGFFSALFGVGGGIVVVPLLLLVAHYSERPAMATSLAAVLVISIAGAATYAFHGEVKLGAAAIVGLPAMAGAVAGTALQQRLANRTLSLAFAALLTALGVRLLV